MLVLKTHLGFVRRIFSDEFSVRNMLRFLSSFMVFVCSCMCYVFGVIVKYTPRYKACGKSELEQSVDRVGDCEDEAKSEDEIGSSFGLNSELATSARKYEFTSGKDIIGYIERPENVCFSVQECCFVSSDDLSFCNSQLCDKGVFAENDFREYVEADEKINPDVDVGYVRYSSSDDSGKEDDVVLVEDKLSMVGEVIELEDSKLGSKDCYDRQELESIGPSYELLGCEREADFIEYVFLPGKLFAVELECKSSVDSSERRVLDNEGSETGNFCAHNKGVSEDDNDELLKPGLYLQSTKGLDKEKLPVDDNCEAELIHQEESIIRTSDEANEQSLKEKLSVNGFHYKEHVGLDEKLQKSVGSEAKKFHADDICQVNSAHKQAEVIETLEEVTEQKLEDSVHVNYEARLVTLDQCLQDYIKLDALNFIGDSICEVDLINQKTEQPRTLNEAMESSLSAELFSCDDSSERFPRVDQHLKMSVQVEAEQSDNASSCEGELLHQKEEAIRTLDETKEPSLQGNTSACNMDDSDDMEEDHDDLVHRLKAELKRVRTGGLPTILEEMESPRVEADFLRPLKIHEKFEHKDRMEEIQKVYKSYADRMRKLDILNYQALNAISLHQKKDSNHYLNSSQKSFILAVKSFLPQKLSLNKARRVAADPTLRCIGNLHKDLEMVYVGQVCLSWEILCWEYWKARELHENDSEVLWQYSGVANDFQLFQVLLQRFLEDEPFQGPRVANYVNNRCSVRSMQVPAIKDDSSKESRFYKKQEQTDAISIKELIGIIEASMQVFWEFLCSDKDADPNAKRTNGSLAELQDLADSELLHSIRIDLQKKDKKLREISRTGNCIINRFRNCRGGDSLHRELFFAQVELKVISRVINVSRLTTNQLLWCREKLSRVDIARSGIYVESMVSLFPC